MAKVRHGVIGLGFFGEYHAQMVASMTGVELTAVCTRTKSRLNEVAEKYGSSKRFTDYHQLLADDQIDSVSIVTHFYDHKDIAADALKVGVKV